MRNWSLAFFQHQLLNFEITQEIQGLFASAPTASGTQRGPIEKGYFDFEITTHAVAAGYRLNDRLSLGLGLSNFRPSSRFGGDEFLPDDDTPEGYFARASFLPDRLSHRFVAQARESDWGLAAGFLWSVGREWKLGGVYREGPKLKFDVTLTAGPLHPDLPPGRRLYLGGALWRLPDVYGLGLSYRSPDGHWAAGLEWNRVEYSTVIESLPTEFTSPGDILDDADEIHLGCEYAFFVDTSIVALRLGAWHDPDHQVRNETAGPFIRAENPAGDDELHLATGVGIALERLQVDLGVDLSERRDTASLSVIYNF
jgi:long-subunit fatty acid transport protein